LLPAANSDPKNLARDLLGDPSSCLMAANRSRQRSTQEIFKD
jgi:hypothetical protein